MAIDAEWEEKTEGNCLFLTTQIAISNDAGDIVQYLLFVNEDLYKSDIHQLDKYRNIPVDIIPWKIGGEPIINYFSDLPKKLDIYTFYSPIDYECLLGTENWKYLLNKGFVNKKRNIYINWNDRAFKYLKLNPNILNCHLNFIDVFGRVGCGLEEAYNTLGIDTSDGKDYIKTFNVDKSTMSEFFTNHPNEFIKYSLGDLDLHKLCYYLYSYMKEILEECFGLKDLFSSLDKYPGTVGSLVNQIFLGFLEKKYPDIFYRLSYLTTSADNKKCDKVRDILSSKNKNEKSKTEQILNLKGVIHGLGAGSIPAFFPGNYDMNGKSPFGAVVHGGRTVKEVADRTSFEDVFDIDLTSAYGAALNSFEYPLGLPTCVSLANNTLKKKRLSLKQVLTKYKKQLIDGLYTIYVSGELKTPQDLLISKYGLTTEKIGAKLLSGKYEDNDDTFSGRLGGEVLLTTRQIELSVITSENLKVLKAVCSPSELSDIYNLEVQALIFYPKDKELSLNDWVKTYENPETLNPNFSSLKDLRSKQWSKFKLSEFLNPLLEKREEFKRLSEKNVVYITKQKLLKLIINTVYGNLASPFFQMGNTVVANNITCKVRTSVWMMAKALGTIITVTDGGFYQFKEVPYLKSNLKRFKKPGLNALINPIKHTFVGNKKLLEEFDVSTCTKEQIDKLALAHIKEFWSIYKLDFSSAIEHKFENSSKIAITSPYTKVDYLLIPYEGERKEIYKVRGVKQNELDIHPKIEVLRAKKENRKISFQEVVLKIVIGINEYLISRDKDILPGHIKEQLFVYRPNIHAPDLFETYEAYEQSLDAFRKRKSKYEDLSTVYGPTPLFKG